jgi:hypothetical protein
MGNRIPGVLGINPPLPQTAGGSAALPGVTHQPPGTTAAHGGSGTPAITAPQITGWPRNLTWADFPEVTSRPGKEVEDARITADADLKWVCSHHGGLFHLTSLTITMRVVPEKTWVVRTLETDSLLKHEQGHYDIVGLMARDMAKEILEARDHTEKGFNKKLARIRKSYQEKTDHLNDQYDSATEHSRNRKIQQLWDRQISGAIQAGKPLSRP